MERVTVTFFPDNRQVTVEQGTTLFNAAVRAGIRLTASCGGQGACGRCLLRVRSGEVLQKTGCANGAGDEGFVLACHTLVKSDVVVEVPEQSRLSKARVLVEEDEDLLGENGFDHTALYEFSPPCCQVTLEVAPPTLTDNASDLARFKSELKKKIGHDRINVGLNVLRKLATALRKEWKVTATVFDLENTCEVIDIEPASEAGRCCGLAVDIGTTTVVACLVDLATGRVLGRAGNQNGQAKFGDDVISRMVYAEEENGLEMLQKAVVDSINELVWSLTEKTGIKQEEIKLVAAAGNTVMTHLFLGLDPRFIRREPYVPTASVFPAVDAAQLGLAVYPQARVINLPAVASYVGGDIVAGVLVNGQARSDEVVLYIDIGTNGEIVLGNRDWLVACACSAGPAFEGGGITYGMRATRGAIERVSIDLEKDLVELETIGRAKPIGICGSGLIDCVAELLRVGAVDRTGRIALDPGHHRVRENQGDKEFVLAWSWQTGNGKDIVISESDIQNVLRAKGAVFAGVQSLLKAVGLDISAVDRVIVAGGFGSYINVKDAVRIGLLPDLPLEKYRFIGNASVKGAQVVLTSREAYGEASEIGSRMTYIELSNGTAFMDEFVSALFFPHTDLELFPSLGD